MAYERDSSYRRVFDQAQAPAFMAMLASRHGSGSSQAVDPVYLDLGCASGHTILALAPLYPHITFIGLDFNPAHIATAAAEAERLVLPNTRFIEADFRSPPADLPQAHWLVVRGIYSWLAPEARAALERLLVRQAAPGALLKLHYSVRPGACLRQSLMTLLNAALPADRTPDQGRALAREVLAESEPLQALFSQARTRLEALPGETDEAWRHDLFNTDFQIESSQEVLERFERLGFRYVASSTPERNLPAVLISAAMAQRVAQLPAPAAQTLIDHLTANGSRDDLLLRPPIQPSPAEYPPQLRIGLIVPPSKMALPHQTVRGQVLFTRADCGVILAALEASPLAIAELRAILPADAAANLGFWLDLLVAAQRVGPFLASDAAATIDRVRLRRINRERLKDAVAQLSVETRTPLLAAEYGNCLEAGWFESLVLAHFDRRHRRETQQAMLSRIHAAGLGFRGGDGQAAPDQAAALRVELGKLEVDYISRMAYWGIEV